MNKIRVIDLLNKIANGEEVPNKIRIDHWCYEFEWVEYLKNYYDKSADLDLMSVLSMSQEELNYEVKIIEEKIEIIEEDKILDIIFQYGYKHQIRKFNEETFELMEAIINFETGNKSNYTAEQIIEHQKAIAEEIADVMVLLEQFRLFYGISEKEIKKIMEEKVERQLKRMEDEN